MTWETVRLGDLIELRYGKALKAEDRVPGAFPVVGSGGIAGTHSSALVTTPTIVVGRKGSIGSLTWAPDGCWPIDTAYYTHPKRTFDQRWLYWTMQSLGLSQMNKSAAVPGLNREDAYRASVFLPPLPEQRRIAAILDEADALRRQAAEVHDRYKVVRQDLFHAEFGQVEQLLAHQDARALSDVATVWDCPHSTPKWTETGVTCVRTPNLGYGVWNWSDHRFVSETTHIERTQRSEPSSGDIILSREGTVGVAAIVPDAMRLSMGQRLVQVRPDRSRLTSSYLLQYLLESTAPQRIGRLMVGSTSTHLNVRDLRALPIYVPALERQHRFDLQVRQLEGLHVSARERFAGISALFASLQHRAFRGEL